MFVKLYAISSVLLIVAFVFIFRCDAVNNTEDGADIHFPEDKTVNQKTKIYTPKINITSCKGKTICTNVLNYPTELVENFFKRNNGSFRHLLGYDDVKAEIGSRVNILEEGNSFCKSKKHLEKPQAAQNDKNDWFFLVNHEPYVQAIETDICEGEGKPCFMSEIFPKRTECRQKYIYRKMLAIDPTDGQVKPETIKLPSCCSCHLFEK